LPRDEDKYLWRQSLSQLVKDHTAHFDTGEYLGDLFQSMMDDRNQSERPDVSETDVIADMDQMCKFYQET
jgi:hypothetical protein